MVFSTFIGISFQSNRKHFTLVSKLVHLFVLIRYVVMEFYDKGLDNIVEVVNGRLCLQNFIWHFIVVFDLKFEIISMQSNG